MRLETDDAEVSASSHSSDQFGRKVCILSSVHPALDNRIFYREARTLRQAGYDVVLIAQHDKDEVRDGIQILALPSVPRWQRPRLWWLILMKARAVGANLFHFHDPELLLVVPWLKLLTRRPTIYDVHEANADFIRLKRYLPGWLRRPLAALVAALEPRLAAFHDGLIFADERIAASFHQVELPCATVPNYPLRDLLADAMSVTRESIREKQLVVHLGAHDPYRGSRLMVDAFETVVRRLPEARLWLIGSFVEESHERELRQVIHTRGLSDSIKLLGRVPFADIGHYLSLAQVGWVALQKVPKYEKNVPTKLFEYLAFGLPVVASDLPSVRQFAVDDGPIVLVAPGVAGEHAAALVELLADPGEGRRLGIVGQQMVNDRYNWSEVEDRLLALYDTVLNAC
ncbi:MAG: glycosyltransferase [Candidatus Promineifilaceae bacterium]|nr:glycosyltransferase [Candidatus Promineifilaceae bacterium]